MILSFFAVGAGCFVGGILRYLCTLWLPITLGHWPWATFLVNIVGCFVLGLLNGRMSHFPLPDAWRLFLTVGLCGGFTTFSTFINEGFQLERSGLMGLSGLYSLSSLIIGGICLIIGYRLTGG